MCLGVCVCVTRLVRVVAGEMGEEREGRITAEMEEEEELGGGTAKSATRTRLRFHILPCFSIFFLTQKQFCPYITKINIVGF